MIGSHCPRGGGPRDVLALANDLPLDWTGLDRTGPDRTGPDPLARAASQAYLSHHFPPRPPPPLSRQKQKKKKTKEKKKEKEKEKEKKQKQATAGGKCVSVHNPKPPPPPYRPVCPSVRPSVLGESSARVRNGQEAHAGQRRRAGGWRGRNDRLSGQNPLVLAPVPRPQRCLCGYIHTCAESAQTRSSWSTPLYIRARRPGCSRPPRESRDRATLAVLASTA